MPHFVLTSLLNVNFKWLSKLLALHLESTLESTLIKLASLGIDIFLIYDGDNL